MAAYPWIVPHKRQGQNLDDYPNIKCWFATIERRDAVQTAYAIAKSINTLPTVTEEARAILFGQGRLAPR